MRKVLVIFFSGILLFAGGSSARAQEAPRVSLFALQTSSFPSMTATMDVFNAAGSFVTGLAPEAVTLLEDNLPRPLSGLEELQPGTEFAMAFNPGPFFAYRDSNAVTHLDKVLQVVKDWAAAHPDALGDDLSLILGGGTSVLHLASTATFSEVLGTYKPDLQKIVSSPGILSSALDAVSATSSLPGKKPVVLYITSVPAEADIPVLQNLGQRAVAGFIRVNVWIVASKDFFSASGATALKDLAIQTGGQYSTFSGTEPLPSPEEYLAPLRHTYRLEYSSSILASGAHTLAVQVDLNGEKVNSADLSFEMDIQPPNPILVAPPVQIVRTAPDAKTTSITSFVPTQQAINILVEFPDKRTPSLVRTVLYVDGVQVGENTTEPFDQFTWDLSGYTTSGQHMLTVEAVDNIGLSKVSLGIPVLVTIVRPRFGLLPWLSRNSTWVALGAIFFAGGGLLVILTRTRIRNRRARAGERGSRNDPLTQTVIERRKSGLSKPKSRPVKTSDAYLVRLKEDGVPVTAPPIPIAASEITFGSDPIQSSYILDDPSVSPLHARLREVDGEFILSDEKSVAGTWVNYEQVVSPRSLRHGDLLQFGRMSYRFMLKNPPERREIRVVPTKK